jgi:protocatechuate 3,4-dioxygenase alpha subunit
MTERLGLTPAQTVGPFLSIGLLWDDGPYVVPADSPGSVEISGYLYDGNGAAVPDGLIETWQADANGGFSHPDDPRSAAAPDPEGFRGFGRCGTDLAGRWHISTVKPGTFPTPGGATEAPHLDVSVFARGLLDRVVTRIYFPDEAALNDTDPVLSAIEPTRRATLVAAAEGNGLRFDIHLQGPDETVFFDV